MDFIAGHNPDLVLYEGAVETDRIDLTHYDSAEALRELLRARRITLKKSEL